MGVVYDVASFLSPVYAGWAFDITEDYTLVLITFAIILLIAASIFVFCRIFRKFEAKIFSCLEWKIIHCAMK
jgi:hypothetical protein